jgi:FkbM family methyltransferase
VVAIEASPANFQALQENLALNDDPESVRTVNRAAADVAGAVSIFSGPVHNVGLATTVESRGLPLEAEVAAAPLADLLEPQEAGAARLVKIDVEGGEDLVIRGMAEFLTRCRDDVEILLELSPRWWADRRQTAQQVLQPLFDAGFHVYRIDNNLWPWRYLWPNDVRSPRGLSNLPTRRLKRVDLVLSRVEQEEL